MRRQRDDRREVAQVLADRAPHFVSSWSLAGTSETLRSRPCCRISVRRKSTVSCSGFWSWSSDGAGSGKPLRAGLRDRAQVGRLLGLARHVGPQRRALVVLRDRRVDALDRVAGEEEAVGAERVGELRRGDQHAEPLAVRVARAALAGEAGERLRRLLVDRALGGERLVVDRVLAPGQDDLVLAARRRADLLEAAARCASRASSAGARRGAGRATRPRSSGSETRPRTCCTNGTAASSVGFVERTAGRASRIRRRTGGNAAFSVRSAGSAAPSVRGSSATAADSCRSWAASVAAVVSKSTMSDLSAVDVAVERGGDLPSSRDEAREVVVLGALQRVGDDRGVAVGRAPRTGSSGSARGRRRRRGRSRAPPGCPAGRGGSAPAGPTGSGRAGPARPSG